MADLLCLSMLLATGVAYLFLQYGTTLRGFVKVGEEPDHSSAGYCAIVWIGVARLSRNIPALNSNVSAAMTPIDSSLLAGALKRSSCWCAWWPVSNVLVVFVTRTSLLHDMLSSLGRAYPDSGDI